MLSDEEIDAAGNMLLEGNQARPFYREFARAIESLVTERAADVRPPRSAMSKPPGDWYECGWNDAVVAMAAAIRGDGEKP